ncbi:unnamed protein product [Clavelina lepadiformis]|uniref:T-box domain-containing protein n=1 Tax=Clavelina lepadiformis TaxID=159417 RepID=A0ABP0GWH1_CLALP
MSRKGIPLKTQHCFNGDQQLEGGENVPSENRQRNRIQEDNQSRFQRPNLNQQFNFQLMQQLSRMGQMFSALWNPSLPHYNVPRFNHQHLPGLRSVNPFPYQQYRQTLNSAASNGARGGNPINLCRSASTPTIMPPDTNGSARLRRPCFVPARHASFRPVCGLPTAPPHFIRQNNLNIPQRQEHSSSLDLQFPVSSNPRSLLMPNMNRCLLPRNPLGLQPQTYSQPRPSKSVSEPAAIVQCGNQPPVPFTVIPGTENDWEIECLGVTARLKNRELWSSFDKFTMEMVIGRDGRCMFPALNYELSGLDRNRLYTVCVDFVLTSDQVWKYEDANQTWSPKGPPCKDRLVLPYNQFSFHPASAATGGFWNDEGADFRQLKLSNQFHKNSDTIATLTSMQHFLPRLHIVELPHKNLLVENNLKTFLFRKTSFVTVTTYQNRKLIDLKIKHNPHSSYKSQQRVLKVLDPDDVLAESETDSEPERTGVENKRRKFETNACSSKDVLADHQLVNIDRSYPVVPRPETSFNPNELKMQETSQKNLPVEDTGSCSSDNSCFEVLQEKTKPNDFNDFY